MKLLPLKFPSRFESVKWVSFLSSNATLSGLATLLDSVFFSSESLGKLALCILDLWQSCMMKRNRFVHYRINSMKVAQSLRGILMLLDLKILQLCP